MNPISDEVLMAYADGELTLDERRHIEQRLKLEPALRARLAPFVETREQIANAFEHTLDEPVPQRLLDTVLRNRVIYPAWSTPPPRKLSVIGRVRDTIGSALSMLSPSSLGFTPAMAASMALVLAVGLTGGWIAGRAKTASPSLLSASGSTVVANGALAEALETVPSRSLSDPATRDARIVPVLSFKTADGTVCREYRAREDGAKRDRAGLACRAADGQWHVTLHVETPKLSAPTGDAYETASGANVPSVDALVDSMMSGDALGAEDEHALIARNWQSPATSSGTSSTSTE
jgi:anti-sigma factor RsiW